MAPSAEARARGTRLAPLSALAAVCVSGVSVLSRGDATHTGGRGALAVYVLARRILFRNDHVQAFNRL